MHICTRIIGNLVGVLKHAYVFISFSLYSLVTIIGDHVGIQAHTYFLHLHQTYFTCEKMKNSRPKTKYIVIVCIIANYNLLIPSSFYKLTMIRLFLMHLFRNKSKHESYPQSKFHNISLILNILDHKETINYWSNNF